MPPDLSSYQQNLPSQQAQPEAPRPHHWKRWGLIILGTVIVLGGVGYGISQLLSGSNNPGNKPTPTPAPAVSADERSKVADRPLGTSQLDVTNLIAQTGDISTLLVKALQVTETITLGGNLTGQGNATIAGTLTAANIQGNGAGLTNVNAALLNGQPGSFYRNLANATGQIAVAQLPADVALRNAANTFTAANTFNAATSFGAATFGGAAVFNGTLTAATANIGVLTLGSPLSVANGGTGLTNVPAQGVLFGQGGGTLAAAVPGGAGLCLISGVTDVSWNVCGGGGAGVASVNGQTGILTIAGATGAGGTITLGDATTSTKGIASFNGSNFSVSGGAVNTIQNIGTGASPTFAGLTTSSITTGSITSGSGLTVGSIAQALTMQGAATTITANSGGFATTLNFQAPTANVTYRLLTTTAGNYDICTTAGNCVGTGGGVTTPGGTSGRIAKFTGAQTLADSLITDNGALVTVGGNFSVTGTASITGALTLTSALAISSGGTGATSASGARTNLGAAASGANTDITSLGGLTTALSVAQGGTGAVSLTNNGVVIGQGTAALTTVTAGGTGLCLMSTAGAPSFQACPGSGGVSSLNGLTGALTVANATPSGSTITINDATTSAKGIASFNGTNFSITSGAVNTIQNIDTAASPTFAALTAPTVNANTITPSGALTVGATGQSFTLQGSAGSTITAGSGGTITTIGFSGSPAGAVTYNFDRSVTPGTYNICTTAGNCVGTGGGVTTSGGTTNAIPRFTASQSLGDSAISDNGSVITMSRPLDLTQVSPSAALTIGSTSHTLTLQGGASTKLTATASGITNSLQFATPATSNKTITLPNASGTVAVSAAGPLLLDGAGNISCPTCVTSGGGGGGSAAVDSLNGLTGTLLLANSTGSGSTITIDDATTSAKGIASFNSANFSVTGGAVNTIQNIGTGASPTFAGLTASTINTNTISPSSALTIGSTGQQFTLQGNNSSAITVTNGGTTNTLQFAAASGAGKTITIPNANGTVAVSASGPLALDSAGNLTCPTCLTSGGGSGVTSLNGLTGTLTVNNASGSGSAITIDDATTGAKGIASFSSTNFTVTGGLVNTIQNIGTGASPTFAGVTASTVNANTVTPSSAFTLGATGQSFTLQGSASSTITAGSGGTMTTVGFTGSPTGAVTYNFDRSATAGTYGICTTAGNCVGTGGGVSTPGGTTNALAKFTGSQTIGNSIISDDGATASVTGNMLVQDAAVATKAYRLRTSGGLLDLESGGSQLVISSWQNADFTGTQYEKLVFENTTSITQAIKTWQFRDVANGTTRHTIDGSTGANVAFNQNGEATNFTVQGDTDTNLLFVQGSSDRVGIGTNTPGAKLDVNGTFNASGNITTSGDVAVNGGDITSSGALNITPTGSLTLGATGQAFTLQGLGSASTITANGGGGTTTIGFSGTPTGSVIYNFDRAAAANTYTICTTAGNCNGAGVTLQSAYNSSTTPEITVNGTNGALTIRDNASAIGANLFEVQNNAQSVTYLGVNASGISVTGAAAVSGTINTNTFTGTGLTFGSGATATIQPASNQALNITAHGSSTWSTDSGSLDLQASTSLNLGNGGGGTINVGTNNGSHTIAIGTSASGTQAISVGNTSASGSTSISGGTSGLFLQSGDGIFLDAATNISTEDGFDSTSYLSAATGGIGQYGNLLTFSEQFDNAAWVKSNVSAPTANTIVAPDGQTTAEILADSSTGGSVAQTSGTAAGSTYTFSVWLKASGFATAELRIDGASSGTGTAASVSVGSTWRRYMVTQNTASFTGNVKAVIFPGGSGGSNTVHAWGAQLVQASNALAYVRTGVSTVTATRGIVANGDFTMSSGAFLQSGTGTFSTGTGSVSLNGSTTIASGQTLTVTSALTSLTGASTGDALSVSNSSSTGNIAVFKDNATAVMTIADGGGISLQNTVDSTSAFKISTSAGGTNVPLLQVNTTGTNTGTYISGSGTGGGGGRIFFGPVGDNSVSIGEDSNTDTDRLQLFGRAGIKFYTNTAPGSQVGIISINGKYTLNATNDANGGFIYQNASSLDLFNIGSADNTVTIGRGTIADTNAVLFVLDGYNTVADPTGIEGSMYYNQKTGSFRCYEGARWAECLGVPKPNTRRWTYLTYPGSGTAWDLNGDIATAGTTPTSVAATTSEPGMLQYATGTTTGDNNTLEGNLNYNTSNNPTYQTYVAMSSTASLRTWYGLSDQTAATMQSTGVPGGNYAAFRFDNDLGDTNYKCITANAGSQTITGTPTPFGSPGTGGHKLEISIVNGVKVVFKIDGQVACTHSVASGHFLPTTNTMMRHIETVTTQANPGSKNIALGWIYIESDK